MSDYPEYSDEEMQRAKSVAELNGWKYVEARFSGNATFQHETYGIVMADNWIDLCEQYVIGYEAEN